MSEGRLQGYSEEGVTHDEYIAVLETNKPVAKTVMSIISFDHKLYTFKQSKTALT